MKCFYVYNSELDTDGNTRYYGGGGSFGKAPKLYNTMGNLKNALNNGVFFKFDPNNMPTGRNWYKITPQTTLISKSGEYYNVKVPDTYMVQEMILDGPCIGSNQVYSLYDVIQEILAKR